MVAVEADYIRESNPGFLLKLAAEAVNQRAGTLLGIQLFCKGKQRLKVLVSAITGGIRFVGDAPHDDAGKVLVSGDQVADDVAVMGSSLHTLFGVKGGVLDAAEEAAAHLEV